MDTPLISLAPASNDTALDPRFTSWLTSFAAVTGIASNGDSLSCNAEAFLEMFSPMGS